MPYSMSSARMSIEQFLLRRGKMKWLGNERKCGVRFFFLWSFPGDQTRWFTNFQRGNFSEQSILHLTSMEHLSLISYFLLFCFLYFVFFLLHFLWYGFTFEHDPSVSFKVSAREQVCTPYDLSIFFSQHAQMFLRQAFLQSSATCQTIRASDVSGWSLQHWTSETG